MNGARLVVPDARQHEVGLVGVELLELLLEGARAGRTSSPPARASSGMRWIGQRVAVPISASVLKSAQRGQYQPS